MNDTNPSTPLTPDARAVVRAAVKVAAAEHLQAETEMYWRAIEAGDIGQIADHCRREAARLKMFERGAQLFDLILQHKNVIAEMERRINEQRATLARERDDAVEMARRAADHEATQILKAARLQAENLVCQAQEQVAAITNQIPAKQAELDRLQSEIAEARAAAQKVAARLSGQD